jgi:hypothetical protein
MSEDFFGSGVNCGRRLKERANDFLTSLAPLPSSCDLAHQAMQPNCLGRYLRVAFVRDRLAAEERKGPQRRNRLFKTIASERRSEGFAEPFPSLRKQE